MAKRAKKNVADEQSPAEKEIEDRKERAGRDVLLRGEIVAEMNTMQPGYVCKDNGNSATVITFVNAVGWQREEWRKQGMVWSNSDGRIRRSSLSVLDPGRMDRLEEEADKNAGKEGAVRKASSRAVGVSKPARTKVKNEDGLAEAMDGATRTGGALDLEKLSKVAKENGIDLAARWGQLNNGQKSMNLRNALRGKMKKGEKVRVGGWEVSA